jgi:hypothetical protein
VRALSSLSPTRAWVVQYQRPRIAIVDPTRDGASAVVGSIDLTPLRSPADVDPSGALEAARIVRAGGRVFVALQNLSEYTPVTAGTLAVIDPSTGVLIDADPRTAPLDPVVLTGRNPVDVATTAGGRLVVASSGAVAFAPPQMLDGVIEAIDATALRPVAMRVTETQLGGDLAGLVRPLVTDNPVERSEIFEDFWGDDINHCATDHEFSSLGQCDGTAPNDQTTTASQRKIYRIERFREWHRHAPEFFDSADTPSSSRKDDPMESR